MDPRQQTSAVTTIDRVRRSTTSEDVIRVCDLALLYVQTCTKAAIPASNTPAAAK